MEKERKLKKSFLDVIQDTSDQASNKNEKVLIAMLGILAFGILYVNTFILSKRIGTNMDIFGFTMPTVTVIAVISQLQIIVCVLLLVTLRKFGYIIDTAMLFLAVIGAVINLMLYREKYAIQGLFFNACTFFMVFVMYQYIRYSERKYKEILEKREEIQELYKEISESQTILVEQRNKLQEMNGTLEEREEELNQLAYYDSLTGLPNRRMLLDRLDVMIQIGKTQNRQFSVVFIDLDNFKKINDSAGHLVGDEILRVIAQRWGKIISKSDVFGRLGGDEFAIIIQRSLSEDQIVTYMEKLKNAVNERIYYQKREFFIKASFGISMFPKDGDTAESLLKYADVAMYQAKTKKIKKISFFERAMEEKFQYNVLLENYLQQVLIRNELYVVFQPQFYSDTKQLRGFEALARWTTQKIGSISPKDFIPIAEENGMIISMGEWILRESCMYCKNWMDVCNRKFILSVNVSAVQLLDSGFVPMVERILKETEFDPTCLEVEVTESTFITSMNYAVERLKMLKKKGIKVALDDFGTGYASLSYLQSLPIDMIKIDKTFIDSLVTDTRQKAIVKSLVEIAHQLCLKVIAEGVEENEQLEILQGINCDYIQGYLLGKPVDKEKARQIIASA